MRAELLGLGDDTLARLRLQPATAARHRALRELGQLAKRMFDPSLRSVHRSLTVFVATGTETSRPEADAVRALEVLAEAMRTALTDRPLPEVRWWRRRVWWIEEDRQALAASGLGTRDYRRATRPARRHLGGLPPATVLSRRAEVLEAEAGTRGDPAWAAAFGVMLACSRKELALMPKQMVRPAGVAGLSDLRREAGQPEEDPAR
ncbi:hypothetical protein [Streptomyces hydrogenans]|uniref:hypothetical protein n=1 Tax=Streptomyces hydrogenans TaxID=1873719 RepID=UPI0037F5D594